MTLFAELPNISPSCRSCALRIDTQHMKPRHRAIWSGLFRFGR
uniref:Uncharacterized protein n=1 Tax=Pakpunavirus sp. TaxID=2833053 RepID=A0AB39BYV3_9CAUD